MEPRGDEDARTPGAAGSGLPLEFLGACSRTSERRLGPWLTGSGPGARLRREAAGWLGDEIEGWSWLVGLDQGNEGIPRKKGRWRRDGTRGLEFRVVA